MNLLKSCNLLISWTKHSINVPLLPPQTALLASLWSGRASAEWPRMCITFPLRSMTMAYLRWAAPILLLSACAAATAKTPSSPVMWNLSSCQQGWAPELWLPSWPVLLFYWVSLIVIVNNRGSRWFLCVNNRGPADFCQYLHFTPVHAYNNRSLKHL